MDIDNGFLRFKSEEGSHCVRTDAELASAACMFIAEHGASCKDKVKLEVVAGQPVPDDYTDLLELPRQVLFCIALFSKMKSIRRLT